MTAESDEGEAVSETADIEEVESTNPTKQVVENKYPNVPSWEEAISYLLNPKLVGGSKSDKDEDPKNSSAAESDDQSRRRPKRRRSSSKRSGGGNRSQAPKKT